MATHMSRLTRKVPSILTLFSRHAATRHRGPRVFIKFNHQCIKSVHSDPSSETARQYQLMTAVCLERYPVISNQLDPLEREYQDLIQQEELEESYLSEHEIKVNHETELLAKKKKGLTNEEEDSEVLDMSALEAEDKAKAALEEFVPANTVTGADKKNDVKSLERKLDDRLVLLVKSQLGKDKLWMLPQGICHHDKGESLQEAADRVLKAHCNSDNLEFKVRNRIPCGFYKYKYPKAVQQESGKVGAKVFFMKARYVGGDFNANKDMAEDYVWVTRNELDKYVIQSYGHELRKFVMDLSLEPHVEDFELPTYEQSVAGAQN